MDLMNTDVETRVWPSLQTTDGRTLELASGEIADVAVTEAPDDPFLRPVDARGRLKGGRPQGKGSQATSGPQDGPESALTTSGGDFPPVESTHEPAEAEASGKES